MKRIILIAIVLVPVCNYVCGQNSRQILTDMHARYAGKWHKTLSFTQATEMYRNDSLLRTETWYENILYPDHFRIDFGYGDSGRAVIYRNDSAFIFRQGKLAAARADENDLLFLLGGMYFYPIDSVFAKMWRYGYNLDKYHEDKWNGKPVFVIGAGKGEDTVDQIWIEKENFNLVRMINIANGNMQEALFENHVQLSGGFVETQVRFFVNDKLIQTEKYFNLRANEPIRLEIFDPYNFIKTGR